MVITVKFLNFRTPKMFAVITLKFKLRGLSIEKIVRKVHANNVDTDLTAPLGAV